jgi:CheY-specific phosphatase CheX
MPRTLDPEMVQSLAASARDVLETMMAMVPSQTEEVPSPVTDLQDEVVGLLGFTGSHCGTFVVRSSDSLARTIVARMLMMDPAELGSFEAAADGFGELVNMISGNFKNAWVARGNRMDLSVPNVIHKGRVRADAHHEHTMRTCVKLTFAEGELFAGVLIEPQQ